MPYSTPENTVISLHVCIAQVLDGGGVANHSNGTAAQAIGHASPGETRLICNHGLFKGFTPFVTRQQINIGSITNHCLKNPFYCDSLSLKWFWSNVNNLKLQLDVPQWCQVQQPPSCHDTILGQHVNLIFQVPRHIIGHIAPENPYLPSYLPLLVWASIWPRFHSTAWLEKSMELLPSKRW